MTHQQDLERLFVQPEGIYLLNHSVGCMPRGLEQTLNQGYLDAWRSADSDPWPQWLDIVEQFRRQLAGVLGGTADAYCPQVNVSSGLSKLLSCLSPHSNRSTILLSEHDFPSAGFVLQQRVKRGFTLRWLPKEFDYLNPTAWAEVLNADVHTAFITHVHYNTNTRVPVAEVTRLAQQRGIFSIVDIAQSAGVVPIDVEAWHADAVLGSCVKWLCGGPGAGYLWLSEESIGKLAPTDVGWFSHRSPFEFDIRNFEYADSALRFWGGTPSVLPFACAKLSLQTIASIGVEQIYRVNREHLKALLEGVDQDCVVGPKDFEKRGGTLVLDFVNIAEIESLLNKSGVKHDRRSLGIRLSPHIYTKREQVAKVNQILRLGTAPR